MKSAHGMRVSSVNEASFARVTENNAETILYFARVVMRSGES